MLSQTNSIVEVATWHGEGEIKIRTPYHTLSIIRILSLIACCIRTSFVVSSNQLSLTSYLGFVPLLLIGIGLLTAATRRKMAPWAYSAGYS